MNFAFSPEHEVLRQKVRAFCRTHVTPELLERVHAAGEEHDPGFYKLMAEAGFLGMQWPLQWGGQGLDQLFMAVFNEEMSYANAPLGRYNASTVFVGQSIVAYGNEQQKQHWLPRIARGEVTCSWVLTEPDAGSDAAALKLKAVPVAGGYSLTGTKIFISGAGASDLGMVAARTSTGEKKHEGLSMFLVPLRSPGLQLNTMHTLGSFPVYELVFDAVFVPEATLLGQKDQGWKHILTTLSFERSVMARIGRMMRLFDDILAEAAAGRPLDAVERGKLHDFKLRIRSARWLNYKIAWLQTRGIVPAAEASMARVMTTELEVELAALALELFGHSAVTLHSPFERAFRLHLAHMHAGGTLEIQRTVLATVGLGLK